MDSPLRATAQTIKVFETFLDAPKEWQYGYDISRNTGLKSGTLYPILMRLAERDVLETKWEASDPGRPARHMYRLTAAGVRTARELVGSRAGIASRRPAFGV
jgi:PadR family transcriptional regulator, regulatory protein PadR